MSDVIWYPPATGNPGYANPFYSGNWSQFQNSSAPTTNNSGPNPIGMPVYNPPNWLVQPTNPGWNFDQLRAMNPNDQALAMNYYQGLLAYINSASEVQQSQRDYEENARRYNQEWGHTVDQDLWSRGQAEQQLALGNRTQDELTAYRNRTLDQQESEFGRTFGLQQLTQEQLNAYRNRTLDQQESEFGRTFGLQQLTQEQLNAYRNRTLDQQESEFGRTFGLQQQTQNDLTAYRNRTIDQQEAEFARRLGLDTRTQDELTAYRNRTLDQQESEFARRLGLDTRTQEDLTRYRTEQLSNERRGQDIGLQQSAINTWGRREKPNARWM